MVRVVAIFTISLAVACTVLYRCYGVCIYSFFVVFMSRKPTFRKSTFKLFFYILPEMGMRLSRGLRAIPKDVHRDGESTSAEDILRARDTLAAS